MNNRILLILVIVISAFSTLLVNAYALEDSNWFNAKNFWDKVNNMEMFEQYPYDKPKVFVQVIVEDDVPSKVIPDILVKYGDQEEKIKKKEFKKDNRGDTEFKITDSKKICIMAVGYDWKDCKKINKFDESNKVYFYLGR